MTKKLDNSDIINHYNAIRLRVQGSGNLRLVLHSLGDNYTSTLTSLVMEAATNKEPVVYCNFTQQRAQIELKVTAIDETFSISKIIIFVKPRASMYPQ